MDKDMDVAEDMAVVVVVKSCDTLYKSWEQEFINRGPYAKDPVEQDPRQEKPCRHHEEKSDKRSDTMFFREKSRQGCNTDREDDRTDACHQDVIAGHITKTRASLMDTDTRSSKDVPVGAQGRHGVFFITDPLKKKKNLSILFINRIYRFHLSIASGIFVGTEPHNGTRWSGKLDAISGKAR